MAYSRTNQIDNVYLVINTQGSFPKQLSVSEESRFHPDLCGPVPSVPCSLSRLCEPLGLCSAPCLLSLGRT